MADHNLAAPEPLLLKLEVVREAFPERMQAAEVQRDLIRPCENAVEFKDPACAVEQMTSERIADMRAQTAKEVWS